MTESNNRVATPPPGTNLAEFAAAAAQCQACELSGPATQTVFGRGPADARLMLVGEQPGDVEDQRGLPFVGPAGRLLVRAVEEAGIRKDSVYVSGATDKHSSHRKPIGHAHGRSGQFDFAKVEVGNAVETGCRPSSFGGIDTEGVVAAGFQGAGPE
jgi:hypothetical protein